MEKTFMICVCLRTAHQPNKLQTKLTRKDCPAKRTVPYN